MKVNLIAFTQVPGYDGPFNMEEALNFCAKAAGVCYNEENFQKLQNEATDSTKRRLNQVLNSGHHSVFDHFRFTFEFEEIPKIIAMIFNSEHDYATSEKSGRYTKLDKLPQKEQELYNKWKEIFEKIILDTYPQMYKENAKNPMLDIQKKAQENARYFVSVFTPVTNMLYSVSLRQLNYIVYLGNKFINDAKNTEFNIKLKEVLKEFLPLFDEYIVEGLIPKGKNRSLLLFGKEEFHNMDDYYLYDYRHTSYLSFTALAQVHRHRTEDYFAYMPSTFIFYIPKIIRGTEYEEQWKKDMLKVEGDFPQGQLLEVVCHGDIKTLQLQSTERCCGQAQLEVMEYVEEKIAKFIENSPLKQNMLEYTGGHTAKCLFKDGSCSRKCLLGTNQIERKI